jgi:hypothetical protein
MKDIDLIKKALDGVLQAAYPTYGLQLNAKRNTKMKDIT